MVMAAGHFFVVRNLMAKYRFLSSVYFSGGAAPPLYFSATVDTTCWAN